MKNVAKKHRALLEEARRRHLLDIDGIHLCFQILSLSAAIDCDCARLLAPHSLSEGRFVLLFLLEQAQTGLAPHVLAERAGVTRATVTGLLDGMERDALVKRGLDPDDRRRFIVHLTTHGQEVAERVFEMHGRWISSLLEDVSAPERTMLMKIIEKIRKKVACVADEAGGKGCNEYEKQE